jgi:RimJ/RimL family protein N-acetyltransferase
VSVELRRARADDAEFLLALITDEETRPFLGGRAGETLEEVLAEIERSEREPETFGWFVVDVDGERAGCIGFHRTNERNRIVEAGRFAIHPDFRGRRIGDEVARRFQRRLLVDLDFHRIELQIYGFNERAIAHAERSGFVREGVKRKAYFKDGTWQDAVLFSLLREDLEASPAAAAAPES